MTIAMVMELGDRARRAKGHVPLLNIFFVWIQIIVAFCIFCLLVPSKTNEFPYLCVIFCPMIK